MGCWCSGGDDHDGGGGWNAGAVVGIFMKEAERMLGQWQG
jgi:hypothetical protein